MKNDKSLGTKVVPGKELVFRGIPRPRCFLSLGATDGRDISVPRFSESISAQLTAQPRVTLMHFVAVPKHPSQHWLKDTLNCKPDLYLRFRDRIVTALLRQDVLKLASIDFPGPVREPCSSLEFFTSRVLPSVLWTAANGV